MAMNGTRSGMKRKTRVILWIAACVALGGMVLIALIYHILSGPANEWTDDLGGHWSLVNRDWFGSRHIDSTLIYSGEGGKTTVAVMVNQSRYYGDDCLAYSVAGTAGFHYFFACGDREPMRIEPDMKSTWKLDPDALREEYFLNTPSSRVPGTRVLPIQDLKRDAQKQGSRTPRAF